VMLRVSCTPEWEESRIIGYTIRRTESPVEAKEFKDLQEGKGWTNRQTSRLLGCSERAVEEWRAGRNPINETVARLLRLLVTSQ